MLGALLYLRWTSLKNALLVRARRLRQPKYLIGAIVGIAYFYFFFFRRVGTPRRIPAPTIPGATHPILANLPDHWLPLVAGIAAVALLVVFTFMWVVPTARAALGFSEAEIAFLFPAPVTRQALIHFRLISAQLRSLTGALIMGLISNRWTFLGGNALTHAFGWWFIFSTLNLHYNAATFTLTRLADRGLSTVSRRLLVLAGIGVIIGITWWRFPAIVIAPGGDAASTANQVMDWIASATTTAPLGWVLYPLRWVIGPFVAPDTRSFLLALGPALVVVGAHYFWVAQTVVSFEEASIEHAEKRAAKIAAWRSGERRLGGAPTRGRAAPFRLANVGRPELAFLWKNLLSTWPYFNLWVFATIAVIIVVASFWIKAHPAWHTFGTGIGATAAGIGVYLLVIGPQFARQDIRGDMRQLDILKTYPLAGWQIVLGELLTPAAILTGIVWLALLVALLNLEQPRNIPWLTIATRFAAGIGIATVLPAIALLQLLVPNAAAILFPGWAEATRTRGGVLK